MQLTVSGGFLRENVENIGQMYCFPGRLWPDSGFKERHQWLGR